MATWLLSALAVGVGGVMTMSTIMGDWTRYIPSDRYAARRLLPIALLAIAVSYIRPRGDRRSCRHRVRQSELARPGHSSRRPSGAAKPRGPAATAILDRPGQGTISNRSGQTGRSASGG